MNEFGKLTNFKFMQQFFNKSRLQSRQILLSKIYQNNKTNKDDNKKIFTNNSLMNKYTFMTQQNDDKRQLTIQSDHKLNNTISQTFKQLIQWSDYEKTNPIVHEISKIFNLNLDYLDRKPIQEKRVYILQKINEQVQKNININNDFNNLDISTEIVQNNFQLNNQDDANPQNKVEDGFKWLSTNEKYKNLKPIFSEILMERIKLFDQQLSELTSLSTNNNYSTISEIVTTSRSRAVIQSTNSTKKFNRLHHSYTNVNLNTNRKKQITNKLMNDKNGFCDVKIRDQSTFSLSKWTQKEEKQFQIKKNQYKAKNSKILNNPILFQFVKKYTKTVKARENIQKKWQNRQKQQIKPDQLKYLCATSLFLNQTLTFSEKNRYKNNLKSAGKRLISKLQFNIAEHIIETYKIFMKKVFDLRAAYYEQLTSNRKKQYNTNKKKQQQSTQVSKRIQKLMKSIKMYRTIIESEKMKMLLKPKICRWVVLFCQKLKKKAKIKSKGLVDRCKSVNFIKKMQSKQVNPFLMALKKSAPAGKVIKRQNHDNHRSQTKRYVQSDRFIYQPKLEQGISKFNKITLNKSSTATSLALKKQLTGGPLEQRKKVHVNLSKKTVTMDSKKCLSYIIKIQSIWRQHYYRKLYLKIRDQKRRQDQIDFELKYDRLWRIYSSGCKINFNVIQNRLKQFSMRIRNIAQPYIRTYRKPINTFTCFSNYSFSLNEIKFKYNKMSLRRLSEFVQLVQKNHFMKIVQNSYVVTEKQINSTVCKEGATVLWWAVRNSNLELTKKLLEGGGDPNSKNYQNNTCLHQAMKIGDIEIIFILMDYGADLNAKNIKKQTPLYFCTKKMLKLLGLQNGVSNLQTQNPSNIDNNSLFFKPPTEQIYPEHYY